MLPTCLPWIVWPMVVVMELSFRDLRLGDVFDYEVWNRISTASYKCHHVAEFICQELTVDSDLMVLSTAPGRSPRRLATNPETVQDLGEQLLLYLELSCSEASPRLSDLKGNKSVPRGFEDGICWPRFKGWRGCFQKWKHTMPSIPTRKL